jgi:hypothetical protein
MNSSVPSPLRTVVLSAILFVLVSGLVHGQTTWVGGSDLNWSTGANWSPATAPGNGTTAQLNDTKVSPSRSQGLIAGLIVPEAFLVLWF